MEAIWHVYHLPYDPRRPIICVDELPVYRIGEVSTPVPMQAGQPTRYDYEDTRGGTAVRWVAFEPGTGTRLVEISAHRTKADYCRLHQRVAAMWPDAETLVLVQDNLNTHTARSFYENLPPAEAFALAQRFAFHDTPKQGAWLNMAELALSALSRSCLSQRIATIVELDYEVQALVAERNGLKITVDWQFSITQAREKLQRHYEKVKSKN